LRWYCSRAASSASAEAWEPGPPMMASAGSPGINLMAIKMTVATSHSRIAAAPTRRASQLRMRIGYLLIQPDVVVLRRSNGRGRAHALYLRGIQEMVLLVIERQHVVALEDLLLCL